MITFEPEDIFRLPISESALEYAASEYQELPKANQFMLNDLHESEYAVRGALLFFLHIIKKAMKEDGWTNSSMAEVLEISESAISAWFKNGEIEPKHLTQVVCSDLLNLSITPTRIDCDVHGYRAGIRWVRTNVLQAKTTPKHVPTWDELVLLQSIHANADGNDGSLDLLSEDCQQYFRSWIGKKGKSKKTKVQATLEKWGTAYRLFAYQRCYREQ